MKMLNEDFFDNNDITDEIEELNPLEECEEFPNMLKLDDESYNTFCISLTMRAGMPVKIDDYHYKKMDELEDYITRLINLSWGKICDIVEPVFVYYTMSRNKLFTFKNKEIYTEKKNGHYRVIVEPDKGCFNMMSVLLRYSGKLTPYITIKLFLYMNKSRELLIDIDDSYDAGKPLVMVLTKENELKDTLLHPDITKGYVDTFLLSKMDLNLTTSIKTNWTNMLKQMGMKQSITALYRGIYKEMAPLYILSSKIKDRKYSLESSRCFVELRPQNVDMNKFVKCFSSIYKYKDSSKYTLIDQKIPEDILYGTSYLFEVFKIINQKPYFEYYLLFKNTEYDESGNEIFYIACSKFGMQTERLELMVPAFVFNNNNLKYKEDMKYDGFQSLVPDIRLFFKMMFKNKKLKEMVPEIFLSSGTVKIIN